MFLLFSSYQNRPLDERRKKLIAETLTFCEKITERENAYYDRIQALHENQTILLSEVRSKAKLHTFIKELYTLHGEMKMFIAPKGKARSVHPNDVKPYIQRLIAILLYWQNTNDYCAKYVPKTDKRSLSPINYSKRDLLIEHSLHALGLTLAFYDSTTNQHKALYIGILTVSMVLGGLIAGLATGGLIIPILMGIASGVGVAFFTDIITAKIFDYKLTDANLSGNKAFLAEFDIIWNKRADKDGNILLNVLREWQPKTDDILEKNKDHIPKLIAQELNWIKEVTPGASPKMSK